MAGLPVAGAKVHLNRENRAAREAASATDGSFLFGGLLAGSYSIIAEKDGLGSDAAQAVVAESAARQPITLVLEIQHSAGGATGAQAMEFADTPNFTIAG